MREPFDKLRMNGAGTFYADAAALGVCLRGASVGQSFVYAKGPALDPGHPVVKLVQAEVDAGRCVAHNGGRDGEGALRRLVKVVKRAPPRAAEGLGAGGAEMEPALHPDALRVLGVLIDCAEARARCPSNDRIAELLNLRDRQAVRYRVGQLVASGRIRVIEPERFGPRVIEICATGKRTGKAALQGVKVDG